MTSIICAMCRDTFETKPALSTTCGHIFCPNCATSTFTTCSTCPVCRRVQTFGQLIRLFPEHSTVSPDASRSTTASPDGVPTPQVVPPMPQPPPYQNPGSRPPPSHLLPITPSISSLRISVDVTGKRFPWMQAGVVPACDLDGFPVFLGVATFKNGMHPCKIRVLGLEGRPLTRVSYGGKEHEHLGTTLLLPFNPATMEWVQASHGTIPPGRRPVEGGYERIGGEKFYHALALVEGISVPGKAGENGHLVDS